MTPFFSASGLTFDPAVLLSFEAHDFQSSSLDHLRKILNSETLVIGYELSEPTRIILDRLGVTWINLWHHPIRFLDDVLFAFASNDAGIHEALRAFDLPEETYWLYANRTATMLQLRGEGPVLPEGCGVFIGQTLADKAILHKGKFLNLLDYQEEFTAFARRCPHVYYSRHPWVDRGDEEILRFLSEFGNVEVGNCPAYALFASDRVREVMTISSSAAMEAKYFGKQVTILFRPVFRLGSGSDREEYRSVYQELVSPHFWSTVLAPRLPTRPAPKVTFLSGKDKLRDTLMYYYNYKVLDKVERMRTELEELKRYVAVQSFSKKIDNIRVEQEELRRHMAVHSFLTALVAAAEQARNDGHSAVLVCGAGRLAAPVARIVRKAGLRIRAFTDRNPQLQGTRRERAPVISLEEGLRRKLPCVIGSSDFAAQIAQDIKATARRIGLPVPRIYLPEPYV